MDVGLTIDVQQPTVRPSHPISPKRRVVKKKGKYLTKTNVPLGETTQGKLQAILCFES
jgi:hypothetical protein